MKFLLVGHCGSFNRGCEAIVRTTTEMLNNEFKSPLITISSFDYKNEERINYGKNIKIIPAVKSQDRWTYPWIGRQVLKVCSKKYRQAYWTTEYLPLKKALNESDAVLSIGGDNYTMDYGFPMYFLKLNEYIKENHKPLVIWGASIGPFQEDETAKKIIDNLKSVELITARESETIKYLSKLGITENVKRVADPAFILSTEQIPVKQEWADSSKEILGLNLSPILTKYGENNINEIVRFLKTIMDVNKKLYVLLIPHVTQSYGNNNDFVFMGDIYEQLKNTNRIDRISQEYNVMQIKYIISKCRFFIGTRTHATIAALSMGIPTLSIGYSMKARGINQDIFDSISYVIDINEINSKALMTKFMELHNKESEIKTILVNKIPELKKSAWANVKYLREILK